MRHFLKKAKREVEKQKAERQEREIMALILTQRKVKFVFLLPLIEIKHPLQNQLGLVV